MSEKAEQDPSADRLPLAYRDQRFLDGETARPLRILAEYLRPMEKLASQGVHDTVVFFGSARLAEVGPLGRYYQAARELARRVTEWSLSRRPSSRACLVCTGGGGGIMEAANRGATEAGGRTLGLNIGLPHEQRPNPYITPELSFEFHYFFMRKLWFAHLARAIVVFPGGFGTLDELFELLTLSQTSKLDRSIPVLLYGSEYWSEVLNFDALVKHGTISKGDLDLFQAVDGVDQAMQLLSSVLPGEVEPAGPCFAHSATGDREAGDGPPERASPASPGPVSPDSPSLTPPASAGPTGTHRPQPPDTEDPA